MGLFSFLGKAVKGIGKVVGGVAKLGVGVGLGALKSGLLPVPFGGKVGAIASALINSKRPMGTPSVKIGLGRGMGTPGIRGQPTGGYARPVGYAGPAVLRLSPVLPGGAVATRSGVAPRSSATPPASFGGSGGTPKRKRRSTSSGRKRSTKRRRTTRGRKLKFGSPAWRKKYLGHKRKRR